MPPKRRERPIYQQKPQFAPDPSTPEGQQQLQQRYQNRRPPMRGNAPYRQLPQHMMGGGPNFIPHMNNLEQMDSSQLEGLLMQVISLYGPDLLKQNQQPTYPTQMVAPGQQPQFPPNMYPYYQPRQPRFPQGQRAQVPPQHFYGPQQEEEKVQQEQITKQQNLQSEQEQQDSKETEQISQPVSTGLNIQAPQMPQIPIRMPPMVNQVNPMQRNLCEKHFPEPFIFFLERPMCKKCVPEYLQQKKGIPKRSLSQSQTNEIALRLGLSTAALNAYSSEKNMISRSLDRITNIKKDFKYHEQELKEREKEADQYLRDLPDQMSSMFNELERLVEIQERDFKNEISDVVKRQQQAITKDINSKVPNFTNKLSNRYTQLQQASMLAASTRNEDEQINVLEQYIKIFTELDAEFEKYFNEFESIGKLQRLLDEDPNEIIKDYNELVERNLRLDYNVKSSFIPLATQRLHSFQWNQRFVQIYKIKTNTFEKRVVQMDFEIPLYSRSIAIEDGSIYLIGGFLKRQNKYLTSCHRYDELFCSLTQQASMLYPHADHSLCAIGGFIYVVGTFVNNQVFGYCERYDTQKNKWKVIAPMKIPRSGTAICSYKNQFLFVFGGRIDQKHIVDVIEVYDIKRNAWQEIPTSLVDKTRWVPAYMSLAYQITEKEIMIFGGKSALTFQIFNSVFVFDIEKMVIHERGSLVNPCSFMNLPLVFNHNLYAYGNDIYIHKYSIPEQKWSCILKTIT